MVDAIIAIKGIVRGKTVQLETETGLPDGQEVSVLLTPTPDEQKRKEASERAFGGWREDPDGVDEFVRQVYGDRDTPSRPGVEERAS